MKEKTIWKEGLVKKDYPKLAGDLEVDVAIVGGGMAGMLSAYLLSRAGKRVAVLEKKKVGAGATHYTTAFLTKMIDTDLSDLIKMFGKKNTSLVLDSHQKAIGLFEKIIDEEGIDCEFERCSNFIYANQKKDLEGLEEEFEIMQDLSIESLFYKDGAQLKFPNAGFIEIKKQAKFHPMKFLYALSETAEKAGAKIFENTCVTKVDSGEDSVGICTKEGRVRASKAIITTYEPFNKPLRLYFKKAFYTSYILVGEIPRGAIAEGTYEDTLNPYHYFRIDKGEENDRIIIGGEDHRSDLHVSKEKSFKALSEYAEKILKGIPHSVVRKWKGPILEPVDGLPYIGPLDRESVLYAMAFSGNGMTYSAISAMIFRDMLLKNKNAYSKIYRADRIPGMKPLLKKAKDYGQEFVGGALKNTLRH